MKFDLTKDLRRIHTLWDNFQFYHEKTSDYRFLYLCGPKGSGKTKAAQAYVHAHDYAFYFSFGDLPYKEAIREFANVYYSEIETPSSITEAIERFIFLRKKQPTLVFLEDERTRAMEECKSALLTSANSARNMLPCILCTGSESAGSENEIQLNYLSVAAFSKYFSSYSRRDIMRLHALTGGIQAVAKELDADAGYEENVRRLLRYDSAFSACLPAWLREAFRNPESYYPILNAIAAGRHRLSEIARQIGFPNNKCGTYLDALIRHNFVRAEKLLGAKQATYHLTSSYISAWCRYAYGKKMLNIQHPERYETYVSEDIDEALTLPAFHSACMRFITESWREYLSDFSFPTQDMVERNVKIKLKDKSEVALDYCVRKGGKALICIFADRLDMRFTKADVERIYEAVEIFTPLYDSQLVLFSLERFSDWSVHEASIRDYLHEVTIERLRF